MILCFSFCVFISIFLSAVEQSNHSWSSWTSGLESSVHSSLTMFSEFAFNPFSSIFFFFLNNDTASITKNSFRAHRSVSWACCHSGPWFAQKQSLEEASSSPRSCPLKPTYQHLWRPRTQLSWKQTQPVVDLLFLRSEHVTLSDECGGANA